MALKTIQEMIKNPFLQVAVPMLLAAIILVIIMAKRKYVHLKSILTLLSVVAITVISLCIGIKNLHQSAVASKSEVPNELNEYLVNELLLGENYDPAENLIQMLQKEQGESAKLTLLLARIQTLKQNYRAADALYSKSKLSYESEKLDDFPEDEYQLVHTYVASLDEMQEDGAIVTYLKDQNIDPATYGYEDNGAFSNVSLKNLTDMIQSNLKNEQEILSQSDPDYESYPELGSYVTDMETIYEQYLSTGSYDIDAVNRIKNHLNTMIQKYPYLLNQKYIRLTRLKAMVLTGSYSEIASVADESCSTEELMILSELYMNGYIDEKDFKDDYSTVEADKLQAVLDQCNKIYESEEMQDLSVSTQKAYQANLNFLEQSLKQQNLVTTMNYLQSSMDSVDPSLQSKAYLQLSKMSQYFGVDDKASDYLTSSMNSVGDVQDMDYAQPMYELVGIANGNTEGDSVKNIATYVDQVIDHSLPVQLVDGIEPVSNTQDSEDNEESKEESLFDQDYFNQIKDNLDESNDASENTESDTESEIPFDQFVTNTISKKTATINIGFIDKSEFPKIAAKIQVSSDDIQSVEDFKNLITLTDCHRKVDYQVEKQTYAKSRIILLVDVSGSMSGSIRDLQYAVKSFANNLASNEEVRVIAFSDGIQSDTGFLTNQSKIEEAADNLYDGGGTALYTSLLQVGGNFTSDVNYNNVIICMTDGEDNDPASEADIRNEVSKMCGTNNCTVYTLGLGDSVDTNYLQTIADAGQGSFLYIDQAASLDNFFDFVHNQAENQYIVHYEAKDTVTNKRVLRAELTNDSIQKEKIYYLVEPEYSDNEDAIDSNDITQTTRKVNGLKAKVVYKSNVDVKDQLIGSNFTEDSDISVELKGLIPYTLTATFVNDTTYEITLPYGISPGTYDVEVMINDEFFSLEKELTILVPGTEKSITFGDYTFTCQDSSVDDSGNRVLTGDVTMNGWLHFKGDVTLSGDIEFGDRITVNDYTGSYISYSSLKSKSGLAKFMAAKGISIPLPAFNSFDIYKDEYDPSDYKSFRVEDVYNCNLVNLMFLLIENPQVNVYPDMLYIKNFSVNFDMPFQEALLGKEFNKDLQSTSYDTGFMLTATSVGLKANIEYEMPEEKEARMSTLPLSLKEAKLDVDTFANDYEILTKVAFKSLPKMDALGCSFKVKDGRFDGLGLYAETSDPITLQAAPIPITMNDFGIELSGLSSQEKVDLAYILGLKLSCMFDLNVADAEAVVPGISKLLKMKESPCVLQFDDCTFDMTLAELEFAFNSNLKFLAKFDFGKVEANLGKFSYSNELLNLRSITEYGLRAKLTLGHKFEIPNCTLDLNGSLELVTGYPYTGIHGNVNGDFEISWSILHKEFDFNGDMLVGFIPDSYGDLEFDMILRSGKDGDYTGFRAYVSPSKDFDVDIY